MAPDSIQAVSSRRRFLRLLAMLAIGGRTLLHSRDANAALDAARELARTDIAWPEMTYRTLGRTGWKASRLVFGCGAALARRRRDDLLEAAFDAGINVFDVGFRGYYRDAETHLAAFLKRHRDAVFLISKAMPLRDVEPHQKLSTTQCKSAATAWTGSLEASLAELRVERVDAYYLMASNNVDLISSDEIRLAAEKARAAGKLVHLGLSSHQNAERVLAAAVESEAYALAMIAITPAGWYDWAEKRVLPDSKPMVALEPALARAREAGMGLIGMKAGRTLAGRRWLGRADPGVFDSHYPESLLAADLSPFQRSYAFVLGHGLDAVNADMQSLEHLQENVAAAVSSSRLLA